MKNWIKENGDFLIVSAVMLMSMGCFLFAGCSGSQAAINDQGSYRQVVASQTTAASTSAYTTWNARTWGQSWSRYQQLVIYVSYEAGLQTGDSCFIGTSVDNGTNWFPVAFQAIDSISTGFTATATARSLTIGNRKEAYYVTIPVGPDMYFKVKTNITVATRQWSIWALYRDF